MSHARYEVTDDCPSKMFTADDISLQQLAEENVFVVLLDSTSPDGYLRKELPMCGVSDNAKTETPHIPRTTLSVKVYNDLKNCCRGTKDYSVCKKALLCTPIPVVDPFSANHDKSLEYDYKIIRTTYQVENSDARRR